MIMSEPDASAAKFTDLWRSVSDLCHSNRTEKQMPGTATSPMRKDLQSPKNRGCSRYFGLNNGDSPGDVDPTQDIVWDSTSPGPSNAGTQELWRYQILSTELLRRNESLLLQWIGDSAVPCTPDIKPKARARKKSSRQSSVDDLLKLARQFDENMQQDRESTEQLNTFNNNLNECEDYSKLTESSSHGNVKEVKYPSSSDRVEAELHALFDCSTQRVSGRLSQGSTTSSGSQTMKVQPVTSTSAEPRQSGPKSSGQSNPAGCPAAEKTTCGLSPNNCDDFDDDWENDDILNDSFVLAMTQNPDQQPDTNPKTSLHSTPKTNTTQSASACKPTANTNSVHVPSNTYSKTSYSALQELCPKLKTTNRSTFKLESNPHFQHKEASKPSFTVVQSKPNTTVEKSTTTKTLSTDKLDKITRDQKICVPAHSVKEISDSLWEDGDDDALFYEVCDTMERISNSQQQLVSPSNCKERQDSVTDGQRKTTAPLPINKCGSVNASIGASRNSPCAFIRSKSLPGTNYEAVNFQGWNVPMKGANNKSQMSQSLPGNNMQLDAFSQCRDSSAAFQTGNANVGVKPHTVTARALQKSTAHHTTFKRNVSDSEVIRNKVFITSQMTGKCSAAEIERKKQEALARRRLRMQNSQPNTKP
ncbi:uncharacterized protein V6R79_021751 [Siganus canaliculatus]